MIGRTDRELQPQPFAGGAVAENRKLGRE